MAWVWGYDEHSGRPRYVRQASLVVCCLDGENVVGSNDTSVLQVLDEAHYDIAESGPFSLDWPVAEHSL